MPCGQDQGKVVRSTFGERERGGRHIHLAVANTDVFISAEALEALAFVNLRVIGIQKAAVTEDEVEHR